MERETFFFQLCGLTFQTHLGNYRKEPIISMDLTVHFLRQMKSLKYSAL